MSHSFAGSSAVLCIHPELLACIFVSRRGVPELLGGIPAGKLDEGELFGEAANREFREETGFELNAISPHPIFEGIVINTNALCKVFLGSLSNASWEQLMAQAPYSGPEGLIVRVAPWQMILSEKEIPQFAEFTARFITYLQQSQNSVAEAFANLGLDNVYKSIKNEKL